MGLDMYLFKVKKVKGFTMDTYEEIDEVVMNQPAERFQVTDPDLEELTGIAGANELRGTLHKLEYVDVYTIFEEIMYWRKANAIHDWFVRVVQDGVDECQNHFVTEQQLIDLRDLVTLVLDSKDPALAEVNLAPATGFFFGPTDIDEYYWSYLERTVEQLNWILQNTNFDEYYVIYCSSW